MIGMSGKSKPVKVNIFRFLVLSIIIILYNRTVFPFFILMLSPFALKTHLRNEGRDLIVNKSENASSLTI